MIKKMKNFWVSLEETTCISKRELFLAIMTCTLAGILIGIIFSPIRTITIGSNNSGNGNDNGNNNGNENTGDEEEA